MPDGILIVDDHTLARVAVRRLLEWDGFDVCGEASGGLEAIQKARELAPAIVLLDVNMPGINGIQAAIEIRRIAPATKIVFFTFYRGPRIAEAVLAYGDAFVSKSDASAELVPTIRRVMAARQPAASRCRREAQYLAHASRDPRFRASETPRNRSKNPRHPRANRA